MARPRARTSRHLRARSREDVRGCPAGLLRLCAGQVHLRELFHLASETVARLLQGTSARPVPGYWTRAGHPRSSRSSPRRLPFESHVPGMTFSENHPCDRPLPSVAFYGTSFRIRAWSGRPCSPPLLPPAPREPRSIARILNSTRAKSPMAFSRPLPFLPIPRASSSRPFPSATGRAFSASVLRLTARLLAYRPRPRLPSTRPAHPPPSQPALSQNVFSNELDLFCSHDILPHAGSNCSGPDTSPRRYVLVDAQFRVCTPAHHDALIMTPSRDPDPSTAPACPVSAFSKQRLV